MRNPSGRSPAGCTLVGILAMLAAPATSTPTTRERGARLVVHIGPHKTGSSALQQSLLSLEKAKAHVDSARAEASLETGGVYV